MINHLSPHRNAAPPITKLGVKSLRDDPVFDIPSTFYDENPSRSPQSLKADNKIKDMYMSYDFKLELDDNTPDTGTGGGQNVGFDAKSEYKKFQENLDQKQKDQWKLYYTPRSEEFFEKHLSGKALEAEKY